VLLTCRDGEVSREFGQVLGDDVEDVQPAA
jgi:hypothetical protein